MGTKDSSPKEKKVLVGFGGGVGLLEPQGFQLKEMS